MVPHYTGTTVSYIHILLLPIAQWLEHRWLQARVPGSSPGGDSQFVLQTFPVCLFPSKAVNIIIIIIIIIILLLIFKSRKEKDIWKRVKSNSPPP